MTEGESPAERCKYLTTDPFLHCPTRSLLCLGWRWVPTRPDRVKRVYGSRGSLPWTNAISPVAASTWNAFLFPSFPLLLPSSFSPVSMALMSPAMIRPHFWWLRATFNRRVSQVEPGPGVEFVPAMRLAMSSSWPYNESTVERGGSRAWSV